MRLHLCDGGMVLCDDHLGMSARMTGCDISGQKIETVTAAMAVEEAAEGWEIRCETCGRDYAEAASNAAPHAKCDPGCPGFVGVVGSHWVGCERRDA